MEKQLFYLLTYFLIYSFLGWIMESIFRSIIEKKVINTGFLKGPICPIYGFGALIMVAVLNGLSNNIVQLFISSGFSSKEQFQNIQEEKSFDFHEEEIESTEESDKFNFTDEFITQHNNQMMKKEQNPNNNPWKTNQTCRLISNSVWKQASFSTECSKGKGLANWWICKEKSKKLSGP